MLFWNVKDVEFSLPLLDDHLKAFSQTETEKVFFLLLKVLIMILFKYSNLRFSFVLLDIPIFTYNKSYIQALKDICYFEIWNPYSKCQMQYISIWQNQKREKQKNVQIFLLLLCLFTFVLLESYFEHISCFYNSAKVEPWYFYVRW